MVFVYLWFASLVLCLIMCVRDFLVVVLHFWLERLHLVSIFMYACVLWFQGDAVSGVRTCLPADAVLVFVLDENKRLLVVHHKTRCRAGKRECLFSTHSLSLPLTHTLSFFLSRPLSTSLSLSLSIPPSLIHVDLVSVYMSQRMGVARWQGRGG